MPLGIAQHAVHQLGLRGPCALQKKKFGFISEVPGSSLTLQVNTSGAPVSGTALLPACQA